MEKSSHKHLYKTKPIDNDELRRRRCQNGIELRKVKKEESISKRRNISEDNALKLFDFNLASMDTNQNINMLELYNEIISSRKILTTAKNTTIDKYIEEGILPKLVFSLEKDELPALQYEACWALINIASGTTAHSNSVINSGALPHLVHLLSSPHKNVCEQALWVVGNLIGEGSSFRDKVLTAGCLVPILTLVYSSNANDNALNRTLTWVVLNICRHKIEPNLDDDVINQLLPALGHLIEVHAGDIKILIDAISAITHITDLGLDKIQYAIDTRVLAYIVPFLGHSSTDVKVTTLRAVGNGVTGNDAQTQSILNCGLLAHFAPLLNQSDPTLRKEALWVLSNVAAGNNDQIQALINANLVPCILELAKNAQAIVQKEALWTIGNICIGGSRGQIDYLLQLQAIALLCSNLSLKDVQSKTIILESLKCMIEAYLPDIGPILHAIEECQGFDKIEQVYNGSHGGALQELCHWLMEMSNVEESQKEVRSMLAISEQTQDNFVVNNSSFIL